MDDYQDEIKKCSVDHDKYELGVGAGIKHGYYMDHRIQCPECKEYLEPCEHSNKQVSYGYCNSHGCKGIGGYEFCPDCGELLSYQLDYSECSKEEIEWYEKSKWSNK